ncbi:unnamed protein product [Polarella glacialis]|uniref:Uncharacterized protein n=1 Tax=Polarella glacialis TaxID=89957 RepID=A0A813FMC2_POLGL|nr:unnamed protein product [Polarella glacialis]
MPSRSASPSFEEWWKVAPNILHDADWTLEFDDGDGGKKLSSHSSQWGGQWIRIDEVLDVPLEPNSAMIRPEVKARFKHLAPPPIEQGLHLNMLVQTLGPGDAILKRWVDNKFWKATHVLLTDDLVAPETLTGALSAQEFENVPHLARVTLRRDWPQLGQAGMLVTPHEPEDDKDDELTGRSMTFLSVLWKNPEDASKLCGAVLLHLTSKRFSVLAKQHFGLLTRVAQFGKYHMKTDQGWQELREIDLNFYVVISIKKCKRGPPLLPSQMLREGTVHVAAGDHLGVSMWERSDEERFTLSQYLRRFILSLLGQPEVEVYDAMDGRQLVHYQAAMPRELWISIKPALMKAFAIQKAAYRHAQGGSCAPSLYDDTAARFLPSSEASFSDEESIGTSKDLVKIDVRNSFLFFEVESGGEGEGGGDEDSGEEVSRTTQRKKTALF